MSNTDCKTKERGKKNETVTWVNLTLPSKEKPPSKSPALLGLTVYSTLKSLFVFIIFKLLPWRFGHVEKRFD